MVVGSELGKQIQVTCVPKLPSELYNEVEVKEIGNGARNIQKKGFMVDCVFMAFKDNAQSSLGVSRGAPY